MNKFAEIITEWQNNPAFRAEFAKDPKKALESVQLQLSPEEIQQIQDLLSKDQPSTQNDPLEGRINK